MTTRQWLVVKVLISVVLLGWLFDNIDTTTVLTYLKTFNPVYLLLVFALSLLGFFISTEKWRLLLVATEQKPAFFALLRLFWIGVFFNNFLPGRTGGDVVRAYGITRKAQDKTSATITVIVDRVLNLVALIGIALLALIWSPHILPEDMRNNILVSSSILGGLGILAIGLIFFVTRKIQRLNGIVLFVKKLAQNPIHLTMAIGLAFVYQTTMILSNYAIALGLGFQLSPSTFFVIIPLTALATMLPISLNGWGVREGAYALSFQSFGVAPELAITLSVVATLCMVAVSSIGGLFYISQKLDVSLTSKQLTL
ncbi:MAG: flippase-like domain-containing protein [Candidatus Latescibacteria bacterium]|nr:flippase-like domain-containing protein [Candidatus Latescibacterota bacterium]MBT4138820.1 flippase-like domain-containing protein [Candidatus Latescibacterota bacterium]MBT5830189.1 flippase-like domain-containing protein [Candidatus Latescibacterota bacterium]